jgi:adenylate cyclase
LNIIYCYAGKHEEAVDAIENAMRLNPFPPNTYYRHATLTYCLVRKYEAAIAAGKKAVTLSPNDIFAHSFLTTAYSLAGRQEEARIEGAEVLRLNPKYSAVRAGKLSPFKNQADSELIFNALRKAGLPE